MNVSCINLLKLKEKKVIFKGFDYKELGDTNVFVFIYKDYENLVNVRVASNYNKKDIRPILLNHKKEIDRMLEFNDKVEIVHYVKCPKKKLDSVKKCMSFFENHEVEKYLDSEFYKKIKNNDNSNLVDIKYYYDEDNYEILEGFVFNIDDNNKEASVIITTESFFNDSIKPGTYLTVKINSNELII